MEALDYIAAPHSVYSDNEFLNDKIKLIKRQYCIFIFAAHAMVKLLNEVFFLWRN